MVTPADTEQFSCDIAGQIFQVLDLSAHEAISELFRVNLSLRSFDDPEVDPATMIRKPAIVKIAWEGGKERKLCGRVISFSQVYKGVKDSAKGQDYGDYSALVVPFLWELGLKTNCRIFQQMSADKIVKQVLGDHGIPFESKLQTTYDEREYCVQYRETDLAFISRLMEEEGIFYYFKHDSQDTMVLGDAASAYGTCSPDKKARYRIGAGVLGEPELYLSQLSLEEHLYSGKVKLSDYNYRNPSKELRATKTGPKYTDLEIYDYHLERYREQGRGDNLAQLAADAQAVSTEALSASGNWRSAATGCLVTVEEAYSGKLNGDWVIVSATHYAGEGSMYSVSFEALRSGVVFRPQPRTPQPLMNPQTATVVGKNANDVIYMDDKGRAKVQFHWDLEHQKDDESSCWIRVAQPYAGLDKKSRKHGFHWHPLVGDEVVVDFLEGDPDAPIVVGSVYNFEKTQLNTPEALIANTILTPYQHRLHFDDPNTTITLNTGGREELVMVDKNEDDGKVTLTTRDSQSLVLEDTEDEAGNMLRLSTVDGHQLEMTELEPRFGVGLSTEDGHDLWMNDEERFASLTTTDGHVMRFDDKNRHVTLTTSGGHQAMLHDADKKIVVTSTEGHRLEINDGSGFIEVADKSRKHRIRIDIDGTKITIATDTGNMDIMAPKGKLRIDANSIMMRAKTDFKLQCMKRTVKVSMKSEHKAMNIEEKAQMKHKTSAMNIEEAAGLSLKMKGLTVESSAQVQNTVKGLMVNSKASVLNIIKGLLVKIN